MGDTGSHFLGLADVPPLLAQVAAGTAYHREPVTVAVVALGALPDGVALLVVHDLDLTIEAALMAVVALGVELCVHDVVVDKLHHGLDGFRVVGHVGDLHIGDLAAAGDGLELGLKRQLVEGVDGLPHVDMIAVGVVALVRDIGHLTELLLVDLGEPVAQALGGSAVQGEAQPGLFLPPVAGGPQVLHHPVGELKALLRGVGAALHRHGHLVHADIAQGDGGVAAVEQLVDGFAGLQPGTGTVLPHDGGHVGYGAQQVLVAAHQGLEAQIQAFIQERPELPLVTGGQQADLGQVDGDNPLIEPTFELVLAILVLPGSQVAPATHGGEHIALVILLHLLGGDDVRIHPLGDALGRQVGQVVVLAAGQVVVLIQHIDQLGERRGDIHARRILDALDPLVEDLLEDPGVLLDERVAVPQVHEQGHEGGLSVGGHEGVDLVLDGLNTRLQLVLQPLIHNGSNLFLGQAGDLPGLFLKLVPALGQVLAQGGDVDGLPAVLVGADGSDDLGHDGAGDLEALGALDHLVIHHRTVVQHVPDVDQAAVGAVLHEVVGIVEVEHAVLVGLGAPLGQDNAERQVTACDARHVVPLGGDHPGVLVGVLLRQLTVTTAQQGQHLLVRGVGVPDQLVLISVFDISFGSRCGSVVDEPGLHHVLDVLDVVELRVLGLDLLGDGLCCGQSHLVFLRQALVGGEDCGNNLVAVEGHLRAIPFESVFHFLLPPVSIICKPKAIHMTRLFDLNFLNFFFAIRSSAPLYAILKTKTRPLDGCPGALVDL